ncbi:MAG TPA: bifunctional UDP-N-acetylglucosamine diphosphorylase/glucosamine-1-phosphate N-acetyltransferase GlmU [Clostridiales bacterium]|nr:bifunctional UDP-N-acetylglucosamine diphosphorylase/glucosamine-1-phosphate N-acetyltransferase GlmU [Clostridiales bacterium]
MLSNDVYVIIMAAGEGTRMKSQLPKVLHRVCGRPMIDYVLEGASVVSDNLPILVIGHGSDEVVAHIGDRALYVKQEERLGTGHAVKMAAPYIEGKEGYVVILAGDTPLVRGETLKSMVEYTKDGNYSAVALSAKVDDATGYGRIIRTANGDFDRIVEHRDATQAERRINEINASMYCFRIDSLLSSLGSLSSDNAQGEYYLTDVLSILKNRGESIGIYCLDDYTEILGVNTRKQLSDADSIMRNRINEYHMENGVTIIDPQTTYISPTVNIGQDTIIYPGNVLEGNTSIGKSCILYSNNRIYDSTIGDEVTVESSVILESTVGDGTNIGPFAYVRPGSAIGDNVKIGDFVEIKNSQIGAGTKISHLSYVGDATIGQNVNVGGGVIFVNYDGYVKHRTNVGDNAFIGCNVNLIAPVTVDDNTFIAAGSTITEYVPEDALAIARSKQINKEGWVSKRREKKAQEKD